MIAASRAAQAYRRVESESRSPLELVVMLYDGALRFLGEAQAAHDRKDLRARAHAVSRVLAIVGELQNTLDVEKGGAVADQLDDLYTYIMSRLLDIALKQDMTAVEEARKLLTPIRDAWSQAALRPGSGQATQPSVRPETVQAMPQAVGAP